MKISKDVKEEEKNKQKEWKDEAYQEMRLKMDNDEKNEEMV